MAGCSSLLCGAVEASSQLEERERHPAPHWALVLDRVGKPEGAPDHWGLVGW